MNKTEAVLKTLEIYIEADKYVSQEFYQGLCMKAKEEIEKLQQQLDDYKEGCEGLKMAVADLRVEVDTLRLSIKNANLEKKRDLANKDKEIVVLTNGLISIRKSKEIMETRRFAEEALLKAKEKE